MTNTHFLLSQKGNRRLSSHNSTKSGTDKNRGHSRARLPPNEEDGTVAGTSFRADSTQTVPRGLLPQPGWRPSPPGTQLSYRDLCHHQSLVGLRATGSQTWAGPTSSEPPDPAPEGHSARVAMASLCPDARRKMCRIQNPGRESIFPQGCGGAFHCSVPSSLAAEKSQPFCRLLICTRPGVLSSEACRTFLSQGWWNSTRKCLSRV